MGWHAISNQSFNIKEMQHNFDSRLMANSYSLILAILFSDTCKKASKVMCHSKVYEA